MQIDITPVPLKDRRVKPDFETMLSSEIIYSEHMFTCCWTSQTGWAEAKVHAYSMISLAPSALVLHYGQAIFEGLKVYRNQAGGLNLFRPVMHLERFNRSADRLALPRIDPEISLQGIEALLVLDHEWVPHKPGTSLYIRPVMIATEPYIGLKSSNEVLFFIITRPRGAYYPDGFNPLKIIVSERYSRASPGGLGGVKTVTNYAASLLANREAKEAGFSQVLWLDACKCKYIQEVGSMNIFFKIAGIVLTPPLDGTTLPGVTRDSVIQLLRHWGLPIEEYRLSIDEIIEAQGKGTLEEVFGSGTAAVISPVGLLAYKDKHHTIADGNTGPLARRLYDELVGIQYGQRPDPFDWVHQVNINNEN